MYKTKIHQALLPVMPILDFKGVHVSDADIDITLWEHWVDYLLSFSCVDCHL